MKKDKMTPEQNMEFIRQLFFSSERVELMLIDLKGMETNNKNYVNGWGRYLEKTLENLLSYCKKGITPQDRRTLRVRQNSFYKRKFNGAIKEKLLLKDDSERKINIEDFSRRIDSLLSVAFYANKAEKLRVKNYSEKMNPKTREDRIVIEAYKSLLYDIKRESLRQIIINLMTDKEAKNGNWGFDYDEEKRCYLFRYASEKELTPYSFHIPQSHLRQMFSDEIKSELIKDDTYPYSVSRNPKTEAMFKKEYCKKNVIELMNPLTPDIVELLEEGKKSEDEALRLACKKMLGELEMIQPDNLINPKIDTMSIYRKEQKKRILDEIIKSGGNILIQKGNNLDIKATKAIIKQYFEQNKKGLNLGDDFKIIFHQVSAGAKRGENGERFPCFDVGYLKGISFENNGTPHINADTKKGEKSTVAVLKSLGFEVPSMIVEYADKVIRDKRALDSKDGCSLAREVPEEQLLEYAKARDEKTGKYLMESSLTDEQLKRYGLFEFSQKREKEIEEIKTELKNNSYKKYGKRIAIVKRFLYNGSFIAYALGYDCYISMGERQHNQTTFAININPDSKNEKGEMLQIPKETIEELKREVPIFETDVMSGKTKKGNMFVREGNTQVIVGGGKNTVLYTNIPLNKLYKKFTADLIPEKSTLIAQTSRFRSIKEKNESVIEKLQADVNKNNLPNKIDDKTVPEQ